MKDKKPVANAAFGYHRIPRHYFVTPRRSGLPHGYFRTWKDMVSADDVVVVVVVLCFVVGLIVAK
jgi:hypothetical protein